MSNQKTITLSTPRLLLRAAKSEDSKALHEAFKNEDVMQYWSEPPHSSLTRTESWLNGMTSSRQNGITDFIVCLHSNPNEAIGKIGVYRSRPSNEIGFMLNREYWGQGLAKEALTAMLNYLFNLRPGGEGEEILEGEEGLDEHTRLSGEEMNAEWMYSSITADVDPRNEGSIRVLKKVGFVEGELVQACFQRGHELADSLYLRLEREAWVNRG